MKKVKNIKKNYNLPNIKKHNEQHHSKNGPLTPEGGIIKDNNKIFKLNLTARLQDRTTARPKNNI